MRQCPECFTVFESTLIRRLSPDDEVRVLLGLEPLAPIIENGCPHCLEMRMLQIESQEQIERTERNRARWNASHPDNQVN
jgi:hypothetical protein